MKGFTLIELIIVIVVVGVIASVFAILIIQGIDTYGFITIREDILSEAELAMERMVREIRQIQSYRDLETAEATEVIYLAGSAEFQFVDVHDNIVGFKLDGSQLRRIEFEERDVPQYDDLLADDISSMVFTYWDESNNKLTVPADVTAIKRIEISIQMERQNQEVRIETQVHPRNL